VDVKRKQFRKRNLYNFRSEFRNRNTENITPENEWAYECHHLFHFHSVVIQLHNAISNLIIRPIQSHFWHRLSPVGVTYKTGFRLDDWIYCTIYIHTTWDYRQYSSITDLHTLQFPLHTHYGFHTSLIVSWQRIYNSRSLTSNRTWSLLFTV
jgi:hypothetical protein